VDTAVDGGTTTALLLPLAAAMAGIASPAVAATVNCIMALTTFCARRLAPDFARPQSDIVSATAVVAAATTSAAAAAAPAAVFVAAGAIRGGGGSGRPARRSPTSKRHKWRPGRATSGQQRPEVLVSRGRVGAVGGRRGRAVGGWCRGGRPLRRTSHQGKVVTLPRLRRGVDAQSVCLQLRPLFDWRRRRGLTASSRRRQLRWGWWQEASSPPPRYLSPCGSRRSPAARTNPPRYPAAVHCGARGAPQGCCQ